jgi:hypothetical protein
MLPEIYLAMSLNSNSLKKENSPTESSSSYVESKAIPTSGRYDFNSNTPIIKPYISNLEFMKITDINYMLYNMRDISAEESKFLYELMVSKSKVVKKSVL